ncbi:hypothetical protein T07_11252 [Trichinella nelsoni]|uniref:Uncharacterized protein n=1 Tax=Trichinella nelsoni TaxID=6336 RepID=A0A0V0RTB6_9BILA|nr:hypothetical protein T07_11252 [Trichinella nelsoni]
MKLTMRMQCLFLTKSMRNEFSPFSLLSPQCSKFSKMIHLIFLMRFIEPKMTEEFGADYCFNHYDSNFLFNLVFVDEYALIETNPLCCGSTSALRFSKRLHRPSKRDVLFFFQLNSGCFEYVMLAMLFSYGCGKVDPR